MLARRIIPVILAHGQLEIKGEGFAGWRVRGGLREPIRRFEMRNVDELVILDIDATSAGAEPNVTLVRDYCTELFCPVTVGGGVRTVEHFQQLLANGADKIAINTAAIETPDLITQASQKFGAQAVVVSIDVKGQHVHIRSGTTCTSRDPVEWAQEVERRGAGEILLNRIERDGTLSGYDLDLVGRVANAVSIPVIACGGAGTYEHLRQGLAAGAHAVAAGAMWSFTDARPAEAAEYLASHGISVRTKRAA